MNRKLIAFTFADLCSLFEKAGAVKWQDCPVVSFQIFEKRRVIKFKFYDADTGEIVDNMLSSYHTWDAEICGSFIRMPDATNRMGNLVFTSPYPLPEVQELANPQSH